MRVVVTHHPMDMPLADTRHALVTRAPMAMREFATCGVDLFLSGHLHAGLTVATSVRYKLPGYSAVAVHAGTAVSTRTRDEANSWNLIHVNRREIAVQQMIWNGKRFVQGERETFERSAETDVGEDLGGGVDRAVARTTPSPPGREGRGWVGPKARVRSPKSQPIFDRHRKCRYKARRCTAFPPAAPGRWPAMTTSRGCCPSRRCRARPGARRASPRRCAASMARERHPPSLRRARRVGAGSAAPRSASWYRPR